MLCALRWTRTSTRTCRTPWARRRRAAGGARRAGGGGRAAGAGFTARMALGFPVGGYQAELAAALSGQLVAAGIAAPPGVALDAAITSQAVQRRRKPRGER